MLSNEVCAKLCNLDRLDRDLFLCILWDDGNIINGLGLREHEVWKPDKHGAHMAHKGYNGRIITMWLGDCMERASFRRVTHVRDFGQWISEQHDINGRPWPDQTDERFAPICVAMTLAKFNGIPKILL